MDHSNAVYAELHPMERDGMEVQKNECYKDVIKTPTVTTSNTKSPVEKPSSSKKTVVILGLTFATLLLLLGAVAAIAVYTLMEVFILKSEIASSSMLESAPINSSFEVSDLQKATIEQLKEFNYSITLTELQAQQTANFISALQQNDSILTTKLENLVSSSNAALQQLNNSISTLASLLLEDVISTYLVPSCHDLPPSLPAGYYYILSSTGSAVRQYCPSITTRCGQTGRWRSVANLDMTNSTHQCFSGLRQQVYSRKRVCVRSSDSSGCSSEQLPTTTTYRSVCGLVRAYQFGSTDAFQVIQYNSFSINSIYVDGVTIMHGSPRQHIWTFASARNEQDGASFFGCPCMGGSDTRPAFVGNDYFCDTGTTTGAQTVFYGDDPLWDGAGCGPTNNCCRLDNTPPWSPPWFYKELSQDTTDNIELRVCRDQDHSDEDIAIEAVEMYVK